MYVSKYVCLLLIDLLSVNANKSVADVPLHQGHSPNVEKLLYQPPTLLSQSARTLSRSLNMIDHGNWSSFTELCASLSTLVSETASDLSTSKSGKSDDTKLATSQTKLNNEQKYM